jgi:lipooligosaccharide transport system permease protein
LDVWLKSAGVSLLGSLGEPVLYLIAMGFGLGAYLGTMDGTPYMDYIAPGLILSSGMFAATYECTYGSFLRMMYLKTYDAITTTPVSLEEVIVGDILWGTTKCLISGSVMFLACLIFGLIHSFWAVAIFVILILGGFLFSSLAILITSQAKTFEWFNYYLELFITPMFFFSGVFFPLDHFPRWIKISTHIFPLTHAVRSARNLISGKPSVEILITLGILIVFGFLFFYFAVRQIKKRLIK